jgi:carbonic anhydrase
MPDPLAPANAAGRDEWARLRADADRHAAGRPDGIVEHRPRVAVLACSDARVPPSVVFGRPAGELFVVRIAGNTASATAVASLEYAVGHLDVDLVVVLGHTACGAVAAAIDGSCAGPLAPVVAPICSVVAEHPEADPTEVSHLNVAATMDALVASSAVIADAVAAGRLTIRGAVYDLASGRLRDVDVDDAVDVPESPAGSAGPIRSTMSTASTMSTMSTTTVPTTATPSGSTPHHQEAS